MFSEGIRLCQNVNYLFTKNYELFYSICRLQAMKAFKSMRTLHNYLVLIYLPLQLSGVNDKKYNKQKSCFWRYYVTVAGAA